MHPVLTAFFIVGGFGLLFAGLLVLASKFFHVQENEKVKKIRECLPGINCGACGYSGCDGYAEAVAEGKANPNLCVPGAADVAKELSEILGVKVEHKEVKTAFVKCNGECTAVSKKAVYDGIMTCAAASMLFGGPNACEYGCLGCGDCMKACPTGAICIDSGIAHVNSSLCVGCGVCVKTCPKGIIELYSRDTKYIVMCSSKDKGAVERKKCVNACIVCHKCELECTEGAIKIENNLPVFDYSLCVKCGKCEERCPVHCIKEVDFAADHRVDFDGEDEE